MARYLQDQNKVAMLQESGTYANSSGTGVWVGEVTEHSIEDEEGKIEDRFLGTASRSFGDYAQGPRDVTGTLTLNTQNFRIPFWAIGSNVDAASGTNVLHTATQINTDVRQSAFTSGALNPPISFTLEDSKQATGTGRNFVRTVNGCVPNSTTISVAQGEKVKTEVGYIGQTLTVSSGATTSITQDTVKPYLWSAASLTLGGSSITTSKDINLEINQNLKAPHYLDGSRDISVPFPQNRDHVLSVTVDFDSNDAMMLYDYYKDNTEFNGVFDLDQDSTTGSQHAVFTMSGCVMMKPEVPSTAEGVTEVTLEIKPKNISAAEWTSSTSAVTFNPF